MAIKKVLFHRHNLLIILLLVLAANITLYYTAFGGSILPDNETGVVLGSIINLALVAPILFIAWQQKWDVTNIILAIAATEVVERDNRFHCS